MLHGANASDRIVKLPVGTLIYERKQVNSSMISQNQEKWSGSVSVVEVDMEMLTL